jgi:CRP-like cAMP-binding protein
MPDTLEVLARKLKEHSRLSRDDLATLLDLNHLKRILAPNEDLIRQGDDPKVSAVVLTGMVARYHLLTNGSGQYLSFHMSGDMPDSQSLFIDKMDHAVCAMGHATACPHPS